ncbi:hypothetical protein N9060_00505 [Arenicella sp.]|nr:hypothetical protein [Arenicella sp.]
MKTKFNTLILSVLLISLLSACNLIKRDVDQQPASDSSVQADITRPPVFIKTGDLNTETSPDEVISAEQWQKQQEQEKQ